jgi:hypothetical protein
LSGGGPVVSYTTTSATTALQAAASATPVEQPIEIIGATLTNNDNSNKKESGVEDTTSILVRGKVLNRQSDGALSFVVVQVLEDTSWDGSPTPTTEVVPTAVKNLFGTTATTSPAVTKVVPITKKMKMEGTFSLLFIV